jgi:hypothetical protein
MAVLEDLKKMQDQVARRLGELQPLVAEYEELKQFADRVGIQVPPAAAPNGSSRRRSRANRASSRRAGTSSAGKPAARSQRPSAGRRSSASPGGRQADILRLVRQQPGITVGELGKALSVDSTGLYRPVRALVAEGGIEKRGASLHPAKRAAKTA